MAGNAAEWVQDWYHHSYVGAPADGGAWESPVGPGRVTRGGAWVDGHGFVQVTAREDEGSDARLGSLGFRPAR